MIENKKRTIEKAVMVGLVLPSQQEVKLMEYMDELDFLIQTAGGTVHKRFFQKLPKPNSRTFVGEGKLEEIKAFVFAEGCDLVVFDDELTPAQVKNLENEFKEKDIKVLDRTTLILDIFAQRAQTAHAKTQVELAQLQYLLPRLTRMWTHLERQKGGIGMRGPGESQMESDRRAIKNKIAILRQKLKDIDKVMATQRKNRGELVRVALVGYTNVGKSTIMNSLSKAEVFAENKLFATLDTTVRKVTLNNVPFLLSDTVGFIRKLPTQLVESFKSTLDETREADILVHVVDVSHPNFEDHINVVKNTLEEIGAIDKTTLLVFNKVDAYKNVESVPEWELDGEFERKPLDELKASYLGKENYPCIFISATEKENYEEFRELLFKLVDEVRRVRYPHNKFYI